jgi:hypothetical protein
MGFLLIFYVFGPYSIPGRYWYWVTYVNPGLYTDTGYSICVLTQRVLNRLCSGMQKRWDGQWKLLDLVI